MVWARQSVTFPNIAANGVWLDLLELFRATLGLTANLPGTTVQRIRGDLQFIHGGPPAIGATGVTLGIKVDNLATNASAESVVNLPNDDWMLFQHVPLTMPGATGGGPFDLGSPLALYGAHFDVRSKRRIDEVEETLWLSMVPGDTRANVATDAHGWISILLALP